MLIDTSFHAAVHSVMARAAEQAILPRLGKLLDSDMREKAKDELVTIADRESEQMLAEGLGLLLPEARIVGEEAVDADPSLLNQLSSDLCWIIDPLDGTANFACGTGPFGIIVALAANGLTIGGWIYEPRSRRFCAAAAGSGALINGEPVRTRGTGGKRPVAAISTLLQRTEEGRGLVERIGSRFETRPIPRCAADIYPAMVLGSNDIAVFGRTLPWDHAAGVLLLTESGGKVTRLDGSGYRVTDDRSGLLVAVDECNWQLAMDAVSEAGLLRSAN